VDKVAFTQIDSKLEVTEIVFFWKAFQSTAEQ